VFDRDRFVAECREAVATDPSHKAVREVTARAIRDPASVLHGLGEPTRAGIELLYRSPEITVLNVVWGPRMSVFPHNHTMWAIIGLYTGREDNIFWRRMPGAEERQIEAAAARSLCAGDVDVLGRDIIHSVLNPIDRLTGAIHIYGGDLVAAERREWNAETLQEGPFDYGRAQQRFDDANIKLARR
jgi:predicted metal-dependent enzyme (double-stranded beta helix superfamily)